MSLQFQCPNIADFCDELGKKCPNDCSGAGMCLERNHCFCFAGGSGNDCGTSNGINFIQVTAGLDSPTAGAGRLGASLLGVMILVIGVILN